MPEPMYSAIFNVPGFSPDGDPVDLFTTAAEAWEYLLDDRMEAQENVIACDCELDEGGTCATLISREEWNALVNDEFGITDAKGCGSLHLDVPGGCTMISSLGVAYTVQLVEHADYPHEAGTLIDCPVCEWACFCTDDSAPCVCCER